jgi:hypothetical protein
VARIQFEYDRKLERAKDQLEEAVEGIRTARDAYTKLKENPPTMSDVQGVEDPAYLVPTARTSSSVHRQHEVTKAQTNELADLTLSSEGWTDLVKRLALHINAFPQFETIIAPTRYVEAALAGAIAALQFSHLGKSS